MATTVTRELVTPAKAEKWLNLNKNNRALREGVGEKYAADMKAGRWTECAAPICFYEDGNLADGQHRLFGVVESGMSVWFDIKRGMTREDGLNIDTGQTRNVVDNGRISGIDPDLSMKLISVCLAVHSGDRNGGRMANGATPLSDSQKLEVVHRYRECATWALSHGPRGRGLNSAFVYAAIARAYLAGVDREKLARFGEVLNKGFSNGDHESAAVCMRNHLTSTTPSATEWREYFLKVQNSIEAFLAGRKRTVIKCVSEEAYPLPAAPRGRRAPPAKVAPAKATVKVRRPNGVAHVPSLFN